MFFFLYAVIVVYIRRIKVVVVVHRKAELFENAFTEQEIFLVWTGNILKRTFLKQWPCEYHVLMNCDTQGCAKPLILPANACCASIFFYLLRSLKYICLKAKYHTQGWITEYSLFPHSDLNLFSLECPKTFIRLLKTIKAWLFPYFTQKLRGWSIFQGFSHINLKLFKNNRLANLVIFSWMIYAN